MCPTRGEAYTHTTTTNNNNYIYTDNIQKPESYRITKQIMFNFC